MAVRYLKYITVLLYPLFVMTAKAQNFNIKDYGAVGDGKTINTQAIQKAINQCALKGGHVIIPSGTFLSGTLYMRSNVDLHLLKGGILKGSPEFKDYPDNTVHYENAFTHGRNGKSMANKAFIFAEGATNISFSGNGTIDGNGDNRAFQLGNDDTPQSRLRPCMLLIINCRNIRVTDLNLRNSAYWTQNYLGCDGLTLQRLSVYNQSNYNQDGMDIDAKHVLIEDCKLDVDDDGICFKSHDRNRPVTDVVVQNCSIASNCNAIKFGTMSRGGLENVRISHCTIGKASADKIRHWQQQLQFIDQPVTVISGIAIESVDGAVVKHITINDIVMRDVQTPIFIVLGNRPRKQVGDDNFYQTGNKQASDQSAGTISDVSISNIQAIGHSKMCSSITAYSGHYIERITLRNITINGMGGGTMAEAVLELPERPGAYPENRMYGQIYPASGFFIRHVKDIRLDHIQFSNRQGDARPVILFNDVTRARVDQLKAPKPVGGKPVVLSVNSSEVFVNP